MNRATQHTMIHVLSSEGYTRVEPQDFIASLSDGPTLRSVLEYIERNGTIYVYNDDPNHFYVIECVDPP
jgi:hypothetical protein